MMPAFLRPAPDSLIAAYRRCGSNPRWFALNLLWVLWIFFQPLVMPVDAAYWGSVALGLPLFVLLFFLVHVRPQRETGLYLAAMTALTLLSLPYNPSAWTYGVFACVYVPYRGSLLRSAAWVALIVAVMIGYAWWLGLPRYLLVMIFAICASAASGSLAGRLNMLKNAAQRLSREEVRRLAAVAERERIGRDLHDLLGHTLSLITLKLELSRKLFERDPERARSELGEAEQVARKALAEVRAAVTGIRVTDLASELASARLLLEVSGVALQQLPPARSLPARVEGMLAMVVREAVTNVARHARATQVQIEVQADEERARLCVEDNGHGGVTHYGNGLRGMRERVLAMGGRFEVISPKGQGTRLCIEVPLQEHRSPARAEAGPVDADAMSSRTAVGGLP